MQISRPSTIAEFLDSPATYIKVNSIPFYKQDGIYRQSSNELGRWHKNSSQLMRYNTITNLHLLFFKEMLEMINSDYTKNIIHGLEMKLDRVVVESSQSI